MRNSPVLSGLAVIFLASLAGCASQPEYFIDHDRSFAFESFRTYRWYDDAHPSKTAEYRQYNASDRRVRTYIDRELQRAGFEEISYGEADFLVNYSISREEKTTINNFAGYPPRGVHGGVGVGTYGSAVSVGYSSGPSVKTYREGTVVIDVIDTAEDRIVWRGIAEGRLSKKLSISEKDTLASKLARELMADFPPQQERE
jgi:hypothetical protein